MEKCASSEYMNEFNEKVKFDTNTIKKTKM